MAANWLLSKRDIIDQIPVQEPSVFSPLILPPIFPFILPPVLLLTFNPIPPLILPLSLPLSLPVPLPCRLDAVIQQLLETDRRCSSCKESLLTVRISKRKTKSTYRPWYNANQFYPTDVESRTPTDYRTISKRVFTDSNTTFVTTDDTINKKAHNITNSE